MLSCSIACPSNLTNSCQNLITFNSYINEYNNYNPSTVNTHTVCCKFEIDISVGEWYIQQRQCQEWK